MDKILTCHPFLFSIFPLLSLLFPQFLFDPRAQSFVIRHDIGRETRGHFSIFGDEKFFEIP